MKYLFVVISFLAITSLSFSQNKPQKKSSSFGIGGGVWMSQDEGKSGLLNLSMSYDVKLHDYIFLVLELSQLNFSVDLEDIDGFDVKTSSLNTLYGYSILAGVDDYSISVGAGSIGHPTDNIGILLQLNFKIYGNKYFNLESNIKYTGDFKKLSYYALFFRVSHKLN